MSKQKVDHDGSTTKNPKEKDVFTFEVRNRRLRSLIGRFIPLDDIDVRQEYSGDPLSFWSVQTTGARGNAFLSFLKAQQSDITSGYKAALAEIKLARVRTRKVMDAATARNLVNKERRKSKNAKPGSQVPDRARETCSKRGCYGEAYRDDLCYDHYMIEQKKSVRGVTK